MKCNKIKNDLIYNETNYILNIISMRIDCGLRSIIVYETDIKVSKSFVHVLYFICENLYFDDKW